MKNSELELVCLSDVKPRSYAEYLNSPEEKCTVDNCERPVKYGKILCRYHLHLVHKGIPTS